MPKNKVSDPITDQEIAFARLVLSGAMTDRQAAEAVGLNPDSAAYTKSKPRVRAYMLEHRAAVQKQLVQQEADLSRRAVDGLHRLNLDREQVLNRLWEIANLGPDMTRGSITGQVKALSMIVAMQNFIPDPRALSSDKKSVPATNHHGSTAPNFVIPPAPPVPACRGALRGSGADLSRPAVEGPAVPLNPQSSPTPDHQEAQQQDGFARPASPGVPRKPEFAPGSAAEAPPPYVPLFTSVPDLGVPFAIKKNPVNPFVRPRWALPIPKRIQKYQIL
jgi:hypothetical protein